MSEITQTIKADAISSILAEGDLSRLSARQRNEYYVRLCEATGLQPMLQPFRYLKLSGQLRLYANKSCAEQLRNIHGISIEITDQREDGGLWLVTVVATDKRGRSDSDVGFAQIKGLVGENRGNAILKAVTKAKRRVTLSMTGLGGLMDETEVESVAEMKGVPFEEGDGDGYQEPTPEDSRSPGQVEEAATLIDELAQMRTLGAVAHWAFDRGPRVRELPGEMKMELLKRIVRCVSRWGAGPKEVKLWVTRASMDDWRSHGNLHAAPSQINGEEPEVVFDVF